MGATKLNLRGLKEFLSQKKIPAIKQQIGFLELIRKPHNETINSNIYAHFLSCNINSIKYAFLNALILLIEEKASKKFVFSSINVKTELRTDKGRIDIVVQDLVNVNSILIENKIYHWLDNDLEEYWNFFKINDTKKIGVLLTLKPHEIPENVEGKFINITHWEWISAIKKILDINEIEDIAYRVYLTDFYNTIENISTTYKMNESAKFFFEHASQVNKANITLSEGHNFLTQQYELVAAKLGLKTYGSDINWKNIWDEDNRLDTFLTIDAQDLISGKQSRYKIILELWRADKDRATELTDRFKTHFQFSDKSRGQTDGIYCHLLVKEYEISLSHLDQFADVLVSNIKKDFSIIFIDIVEYLHPEKDIGNWKQNFLN